MKAEGDFGLKQETLAQIREVLQAFPEVEECVIYGSRAMGNHRYNSDIDLSLFGKKLSLTELLRIENELDDLLLPYQIDLSISHQIDNPELVKHIQEFGKVLFERNIEITR
jgi:predicted nucleotidyltransferase